MKSVHFLKKSKSNLVFQKRLYLYSKLQFHNNNILKTRSNFTLLLYIPFLGIGEWYFICVYFILKFNQLFT